ncbi:Hypothetical protein, putative [Bodo saltans]|uniref:Uncharacterized protein n=1 Tax=Bodo saltans TaxID=75058 RepID=A0A0S4KL69_BODSA|nr:Hypothetical protein, putative [Bodo saltans]|eukprot:CUI15351.1 Hypothetical protein, putative [Bodo saltans]
MSLVAASHVVAPTDPLQSATRVLQRARRVLVGPSSIVPTPTVLRYTDVGLLFFINEKQALLHRALSAVDIHENESLAPLRMLVEYINFLVAGLIVEAERIDECAIQLEQDINGVSLEMKKIDLEMQHRKQRVGSVVSRILSQHYRARVTVPNVHSSDQLDSTMASELGELTEGITSLRFMLQQLKAKRKAVGIAQRLLHGSSQDVPAVEAEAIVADLPIGLTVRKAQHSLKDALLPIRNDEELPAMISLLEFVAHMDVGIGAATDDVEAGMMQIRKAMAERERGMKDHHLNALDSRNKQLSTSAVKYNDALRRSILPSGPVRPNSALLGQQQPVASTPQLQHGRAVSNVGETDAFLALYCS